MTALLRNGDYCPDGMGGFRQAWGGEEVLERVLFQLTARRGSFPLLPQVGSRLYLLGREKPAARGTVGAGYAAEALAEVPDLQVTGATWDEGGQRLHVELKWKGAPLTAEVPLCEKGVKDMKTAEAIYDEMADQFAQETGMDLAGAGEMAVRLRALAAQVYGLYLESAWTRKQCFPQTATGEDLDRHAFLRGITRLPASRAAGTLRFSVQTAGTADLPIPQGTVCLTAGLVAFATTQDGVLAAGQTQVDLPAQAVEPGPGGNVPAGTVQTMSVAPVGIAACTNPSSFTGGRAAEGDEALRARVLATYRQLPNGANKAYYAQQALGVEGVTAVTVLPKARGLGTVDVVVTGPNGLPGEDLVDQVQAVLEAQREIAVDLQVRAPTAVTVNLVLSVQPQAGLLPGPVLARVEEAMETWFDGTMLGQDVLLAKIGQRLFQVEGVANYAIEGPSGDVSIDEDELPVLGTLSVEEM